MSHEEWKPIPHLQGYEVSTFGRVRSVDRVVPGRWGPTNYRGRVLWAGTNGKGYPSVRIQGKNYEIHRLMGVTFFTLKPGDVVRHLNDDKADNRVENLAAGSYSDNLADAVRNGHHGQVKKTRCPAGHKLEGDNLRLNAAGHRICVTCRRRANREYMARRRAKS